MKKLLTFLLLCISLTVGATTYYVRTDGSNGNAGTSNTSGGAWLTLSYACAHSTSGDLITVEAGTFVESSQCVLPVGVSIIGQGVTSIIKAGYVGSTTVGLLTITSGSGTTNGNQSVSYLEFDGNSQTGHCAISSYYRNNVTISNCTFQNFSDRGISFDNGGGFMSAPSYYTSGNSVHDCIVTNIGHYDGSYSEYAGVWWYGQTGFYLYNNTFNNTAQTSGNADNIKCSYHSGTKIYNNVFTKPTGDNGGYWNFYSELFFTIGQFDIYGNTFNGNATFDIVDVRPGAGNWLNIYSNLWTNASQVISTSAGVMAIDFEDWGAVQQVKIWDNHFKNQPTGIQFDVVGNSSGKTLVSGKVDYEQIYIFYNIFENEGNSTNTYSPAVDIKPTVPDGNCHVANFYVDNNTMTSNGQGYAGILIETCSDMTNLYFRNNIIQGFASYPVYYSYNTGTPSGATHYIQDNIAYGNSSGNSVYNPVGVSGINYTPGSGFVSTASPAFVSTSDFHLTGGSPAINAGIHITSPIAYTVDYDGVALGNPPEVGAYEYGSFSSPTVTTTAISNIATTSATSGGNVTSDGGASVTSKGVCWGLSSNPTTSGSTTNDGTGTGIYVSSITGLSANTTYHVRAYAINSQGTSYGSDISFTTLSSSTIPTISTTAISNITQTTASSGGNVTSDGGASVTAKGVCWNTSSNPTTSNSHTSDGTGTGSFTSSITGLSASTTYHVRAYATNSVGTAYGTDVLFTTSNPVIPPTLTTTSASSITISTAVSGGNITADGGATITLRGVAYSISPNPTIAGNHTSDGTGTGVFTSNIISLLPSTLYYVRAFATNSAGTAYGNQITFTTTSSVTLPVINTILWTNVTLTTVTIGGNITSDGGATVTARGVCWSTSHNPVVSGSHTTDGSGTGVYTSYMIGLTKITQYYVRAYATNSQGTSYGNEISVVTAATITVTAP